MIFSGDPAALYDSISRHQYKCLYCMFPARPESRSAVPLGPGHTYHATSFYGSIAAWMIGVTGVLATSFLIVCRIHVMRRDIRHFRRRLYDPARQRHSTIHMPAWQRCVFCLSSAEVNEPPPDPTAHLDLRLLTAAYSMRCTNDYVPTPPPYAERDKPDTPPPEYTTLDRSTMHHDGRNSDSAAGETLLHNHDDSAAEQSSKTAEQIRTDNATPS